MKYISTRGDAPVLGFEDVVLAGLASDGGLYVPKTLPSFSKAALAALSKSSYEDVAFAVMSPFVDGAIEDARLREIIADTYKDFNHISRAPLSQLGDELFLLELYHGPTLAFKDFAMQLIGRLFPEILKKRNRRVTIIGATSGDTGSAAIEAFKGRENIDLFILFPKGRVSEVQQRQMTTPVADNLHTIAVEGDFDDCQSLVKQCFNDHAFRDEVQLGAVNSINWARVMAQTVYYFTSALALGGLERPVSFAVPTGNFGDIYAGYLAKKMGLNIDRLIIGTNQNNILHRTVQKGDHTKSPVLPSISPSIDIQVSSNFERLLFALFDEDANVTRETVLQLQNGNGYQLGENMLAKLQAEFDSSECSETETKETIREVYRETGKLICPHSAVGVFAAKANRPANSPVISLATADAAKFPDAVYEATGEKPPLPPFLADLYDREEHYSTMPASLSALQSFVKANLT